MRTRDASANSRPYFYWRKFCGMKAAFTRAFRRSPGFGAAGVGALRGGDLQVRGGSVLGLAYRLVSQ
jgi:hypothetical protein